GQPLFKALLGFYPHQTPQSTKPVPTQDSRLPTLPEFSLFITVLPGLPLLPKAFWTSTAPSAPSNAPVPTPDSRLPTHLDLSRTTRIRFQRQSEAGSPPNTTIYRRFGMSIFALPAPKENQIPIKRRPLASSEAKLRGRLRLNDLSSPTGS